MDFLDDFFVYKNNSVICGLTSELNVFYVLNLFKKQKKNIIFLVSSIYEANNYYNLFQTYSDDVLLFLKDEFISDVVASSPELKLTRLNTLDKLSSKNYIVICNLMGYLMLLPNNEEFLQSKMLIKVGNNLPRKKLLDTLFEFGYNKDALTTASGDFSVRGMIVDIYLINEKHPIRIEFDDDVVSSIRYFDENTQMTINSIDEIMLKPIVEINTNKTSSIYDYTNKATLVNVDLPQINASYKKICEDITAYNERTGGVLPPPLWIAVAIVAGIVVAFVIVHSMKSKLKTVKMQAAAGSYLKNGSLNITQSNDIFLYSNVTRTAKPKENNSSGSSTHTSSSGNTYGGGGGKF